MDGIIVINKPKGCTSHDVVKRIKHIFNEKVGHTGTLDPLATGVLPILIGKGTLLSKYLIEHDKTYEACIQLGKKTTTGDAEGEIIEEKNVLNNLLKKENVEQVLTSFIGKQQQTPPIYSAIKVNGKKLYEYARSGEDIEIKPRNIEIYNIELVEIESEKQEITFKVDCSKGTYIRSLCEDIAQKLGTVGYMKELNRLQVGKFKIENSIKVEDLEDIGKIKQGIITIEEIFSKNNSIIINDKDLKRFLNGISLKCELEDGVCRVYNSSNEFIGTATVKGKLAKRDIIC